MNLNEIYKNFAISFEIFPPKTEQGLLNLYAELEILNRFSPEFISVTYGAGGSTRDRTIDLSLEIKKRFGVDPLVHFTCVGASRDEIEQHLRKVKDLGLSKILALRGDPPAGDAKFVPSANGFSYASELIAFIRQMNGFSIAAAGYPEKHPQAPSMADDMRHLKEKVDAGAEIIITQLFYDNADFFRFTENAAAADIRVPIVPGIMPLTNKAQIEKMAQMCGAKIPSELAGRIETASLEDAQKIGVEYAVKQCEELKKEGAAGFHFYPLNKAAAVSAIIESLGVAK